MLLADTLNLEDFGVSGLVALAVATGRDVRGLQRDASRI
jgi:hypothetical protein